MTLRERLSNDHLVRNSLFLMLSTWTMGLFGFVFWLLAAHLCSSVSIGQATTVISAMSVIAYVSDLGLSQTLIRVLPTSRDANAEINTALVLSSGLAMLIAVGYLVVVPSITPNVEFLRAHLINAVAFVLLNGCAAANLLTDSVFIAHRRAYYNFLVDGVVQGVTKVVLLGGFLAFSAFGIFASTGLASGMAVVASLVFLVWRVGYHPSLRIDIAVFLRTLRFSLANYVGNVFQILPLLVLPVIVVSGDGPRRAAYFFIAFNLANLIYAVPFGMSSSMLAEGSHESADLGALARRAAKILLPLTVGIALVVVVAAHWALLVYGPSYSANATTPLIVLAAALPIVGLNNFGQILLKLRGQLTSLVLLNLASFVTIVALAEMWSSSGLTLIAVAWALGNLVAGVIAVASLLRPAKARSATGARAATDRGRALAMGR